MLNKLVAVLIFCFIFVNTASAQTFEKGEVGYFQYPFAYGNDFVLWPNSHLTGGGLMDGRITKKTAIKIENIKLSRDSLHFLTGKRVFVHGKFHSVGKGEGSYYQVDFLVIYVLPAGESRGR